MKLNSSITLLKKILLRVWRFPWLRVSVTLCLIGFIGMSVFQGIESSKLKGDVTQSTEQSVISEIGEKVVPPAYANTSPTTPAPIVLPPSRIE